MLLLLFLLSNSFVKVIVDRNETKGNLSKKQIIKLNWLLQVKSKKEKNKVKSTDPIKENINSFEKSLQKNLELFRVIIFYEACKMFVLKCYFTTYH